MSDTVIAGGTTYSNVLGVKATDSSDQILTYIRPTGNLEITQNGDNIDVAQYATASVSVSGGSVDTVNNVGVTSGTTNIELYGTAIPMSSTDNTSVKASIESLGTNVTNAETRITKLENGLVYVYIASYSGTALDIPSAKNSSIITENHRLIYYYVSMPGYLTSNLAINTYGTGNGDGYLTISGSVSAATEVKLVLAKPGTNYSV